MQQAGKEFIDSPQKLICYVLNVLHPLHPGLFLREGADDDESLAKHKLQNYRKLPSEILERNFPQVETR
jgi:hypothetical protein